MVPKKLQAYLEKSDAKADAIVHRTVYTAYDLAKTTKLKLEMIAKTMLLKVEPPYGAAKSKYVIAVLPASHQVDMGKLKKFLKVKKISIAQEAVMKKVFKVKPGALTAFGSLHKKTPVVLDATLTKLKKVVARSGSFTDSLMMSGKDFLKAASGEVAVFAKKVGKR